ncbi:hypothetical protein GOP47_0025234 [Adiantum capillus-veneris]|uniref:Uncharacterized protein n=1 Tax=Adiantum capillus-veneris TaxID=13818 RepID=A0A9D4U396_ADICA|nr:hypothetical protein GOP47_0025234 [Adiantum capillus-veneris]
MPQIATAEETCTNPTASPLDSVVAVEADTAIMEAFIASLEEPSSAAAVTLCRPRCRKPCRLRTHHYFSWCCRSCCKLCCRRIPCLHKIFLPLLLQMQVMVQPSQATMLSSMPPEKTKVLLL